MKEHYYFDNAATTLPKPDGIYEAMVEAAKSVGVNPGRSGYALAFEADRLVSETRRLLAEFFHFRDDPNRVVFSLNATDALNAALFGVIDEGDHVITTRLEHNSVLRPLAHLQRDRSVSVTHVKPDAQGFIDPDDVRAALTARTKAIVVNHASNVIGTVQDLAAIGRIARANGCTFIIDSCQSAGVVPIDFDAAGLDILTFTGHKAMFGPMGTGGLLVRAGVEVSPSRYGGTGVDSHSSRQPEQYPYHLEAGTLALPGIAGLNAAQKWFASLGREQVQDVASELSHAEACRIAQEHIERVEKRHLMRLDRAFRAMDGVIVYGPENAERRVATLSINLDATPAEQVGAILDADYHVCVRTGLHCAPLAHEDLGTLASGTVRFAPGYFTEDGDVDHVIDAIAEIADPANRAGLAG